MKLLLQFLFAGLWAGNEGPRHALTDLKEKLEAACPNTHDLNVIVQALRWEDIDAAMGLIQNYVSDALREGYPLELVVISNGHSFGGCTAWALARFVVALQKSLYDDGHEQQVKVRIAFLGMLDPVPNPATDFAFSGPAFTIPAGVEMARCYHASWMPFINHKTIANPSDDWVNVEVSQRDGHNDVPTDPQVQDELVAFSRVVYENMAQESQDVT